MILFSDLKVVNIQYSDKLIEGIKKISKYYDYYHLTPKFSKFLTFKDN